MYVEVVRLGKAAPGDCSSREAYSKDAYDLERFKMVEDIAHQMFADISDKSVADIQNLFIPEAGYPTPKVDLRAGVIKMARYFS